MDSIASSALGISPTTESEVEERKESWQDNGLEALAEQVPTEELTRFLLEKIGGHWDEIPCGFGLESLDEDALRQFKGDARRRLPAIRETDADQIVLKNLGLLDTEGRLARAAVLLFGKDDQPQRLSPTAFVQVGRFRGSGANIVNDKTVTGNLFAQLDGVITTLRGMLQVRYEVPNDSDGEGGIEAIRRREVWEYPLSALREAVANALLHRDYANGGRVMVRVYDDRLIVSNPGTLPEGVTLEDLRRDPHPSILRNPRLADAFFLEGIVERWGTGTIRMAEACKAEGLPAPEFELSSGEFSVTFRKEPYTDEVRKPMSVSDRHIQGVRNMKAKGSESNAKAQSVEQASKRRGKMDVVDSVASRRPDQGAYDKATLREFKEECLTTIAPMMPDDIRQLRLDQGVSQAVLAKILNVTASTVFQWERGDKKPTGSALKLLALMQSKGVTAVL